MTTRSGRHYKDTHTYGESAMTTPEEERGATMEQMLRALLDDRQKREEELREERRRRDDEMEVLRGLLEGARRRDEVAATRRGLDGVKLTKLSDSDDIEAFLTVFERVMQAQEIPETRWTCMLAPQLTGKAQQAYAAMSAANAANYPALKDAILLRYDINNETYRQRFRQTKQKPGETPRELATRLQDLARKWLKDCESVEKILDAVVFEQLLETLPVEMRIWLRERKPTTSAEAGQMAENYLQARGAAGPLPKPEPARRGEKRPMGSLRCHTCGELGHFARDCPKGMKGPERPAREWTRPPKQLERGEVRCFNCGQRGHIAMKCPARALFCRGARQEQGRSDLERERQGTGVFRAGAVEGTLVTDILLDTGCTRTLVRRELVPIEKMLGGEVAIRCAHGDTTRYPLAEVQVTVGERQFVVEAGVSDTLPTSVLLGTDVPEMVGMLQESHCTMKEGDKQGEALAVETRAQARERERAAAIEKVKELTSAAQPKPVESSETPTLEVEPEFVFDDEVLEGGRERQRMTRRQKREQKQLYSQKEQIRSEVREMSGSYPGIEMSVEEIKKLQQEDPTLENARKLAGGSDGCQQGFFYREGLLYRDWRPKKGDSDKVPIEQLVLPSACRGVVMKVAHNIPLAGHLGKNKTTNRVLQRFYWPTVYRDIAGFCRSCGDCQKCPSRRVQKVPLVPLPVMTAPFDRVAMDIVGPLPRSRAGNRYILVFCDYGTRYPEAVPLRNIDAEHVAGELVTLFSRVGIPSEILTDQGTNFMSKLLAEVYRLLSVKAIRTSPYHPQTDGLVERFNHTLKTMLKKAATDDGKDWDRLLPYLLFAYREVPQASTGFSPFELLYGRSVRGPLDVLKEAWEVSNQGDESVVSYVLMVRERLEKMTELVQENLAQSQKQQKAWYDRNARSREFQPGDQVLVLLPTSTNKLVAQWQGPYAVVRRLGKVNYEVEMTDKRKKKRIVHINMLRKWHVPLDSACLMVEMAEDSEESEELVAWDGKHTGDVEERPLVGEDLDEQQRAELGKLLEESRDVLRSEPGRTSWTEHHIDVEGARPVRQTPYRIPHAYRELVQKELAEMEEKGVIEPSTSDWASPIVLVGKKDGTMRLCVDFRRLNGFTHLDAYPMPRVDELIDRLGNARYITTLALSRGYWQVPMAEKSRPLTSFVTPYGLYQFRVMPFGLNGAPATFQRLMDQVTRGLEGFCAAYIDDVVIYSTSWKEHLIHVRTVLGRLRQAGLTAKPRKCQFAMSECSYLGHVVGGGKVKPLPSKLEAVSSYPVPETKKQVRTFLGLTGYYRKFIPSYAQIAVALTDLTKKSAPTRVLWTQSCDLAFTKLKGLLCSKPVLNSPDFNRPFILQTDASDRGVGAVLTQIDGTGEEHPIAFYSRKLLPREEKYSVVEKECLAIRLGVHAFRVYLLGRKFTIYTDHSCLEWLDRLKYDNARLTRWSLSLQPYHFVVRHRAGTANGNADALSRSLPSVN